MVYRLMKKSRMNKPCMCGHGSLTRLEQQHKPAKLAPYIRLALYQPAWIAAFPNLQHTSKAAAPTSTAMSCAV